MATLTKNGKTAMAGAENSAAEQIAMGLPYSVRVELVGEAPLLFHGWNTEAVAVKGGAKKGSADKKTDNVESYVYRDEKGYLCIPGPNIAASIQEAAKYRQDPRSPRKSARDLFRAGVVPLDILAPFLPKSKNWDFLDSRRVRVQQAAVTRVRPAMLSGWRVAFNLRVLLPTYIDADFLYGVIRDAGSFVGLCDHRPTYGRFRIENFQVSEKA